jgi:hypothetical protein
LEILKKEKIDSVFLLKQLSENDMKSVKIPLGDILRIRNNNPREFNLLSFHGTRICAH